MTDVTASKYLKVAAESKSHGMPRLTAQQIGRFISAHAVSIINARAFVVCTCSLHMFAFMIFMFPRQVYVMYVICSILLSTFTTFTTGASAAGGWCNCGQGGQGWCEATGAAVAGRQLRFSSHGLPLCQCQS